MPNPSELQRIHDEREDAETSNRAARKAYADGIDGHMAKRDDPKALIFTPWERSLLRDGLQQRLNSDERLKDLDEERRALIAKLID